MLEQLGIEVGSRATLNQRLQELQSGSAFINSFTVREPEPEGEEEDKQ